LKPITCKKCRTLLSRFIDKELDNDMKGEVINHLRKCSACRKELIRLKKTDNLCTMQFYDEPGEEYWGTLLPRIQSKIPYSEKETLLEKLLTTFKERFFFNPAALRIALAASVIVITAFVFSKVNILSMLNKETGIQSRRLQSLNLEADKTQDGVPAAAPDIKAAEKPILREMTDNTKNLMENPEKKETEKKQENEKVIVQKQPEEKADVKPEKADIKARDLTKTNVEADETGLDKLPKSKIELPKEDKKEVYTGTQITPPAERRISAREIDGGNVISEPLEKADNSLEESNEIRLRREIPLVDDSMEGYFEIKEMIKGETLETQKDLLLLYLTEVKEPEVKQLTAADLAEIFFKLLRENKEQKFLKEASLFYKLHKDILLEYLGNYEYNKRMEMFTQPQ